MLENSRSARSKLPPCKARKISVNGDMRIMKPHTIIEDE
jgi:hypothetical protein